MTALTQLAADETLGRISHADAAAARARLTHDVLDLIRDAHTAGWTYHGYGPLDDRDHVWKAPYPRTERVTWYRGCVAMHDAPGLAARWSMRPESVEEVAQMLALVGLRAQMVGVS